MSLTGRKTGCFHRLVVGYNLTQIPIRALCILNSAVFSTSSSSHWACPSSPSAEWSDHCTSDRSRLVPEVSAFSISCCLLLDVPTEQLHLVVYRIQPLNPVFFNSPVESKFDSQPVQRRKSLSRERCEKIRSLTPGTTHALPFGIQMCCPQAHSTLFLSFWMLEIHCDGLRT